VTNESEQVSQCFRFVREKLRRSIDQAAALFAEFTRVSPFRRFRPYLLSPGIAVDGDRPGVQDAPTTSSLFSMCQSMCATGGHYILGIPSPVQPFRLSSVQAVTHGAGRIAGYEDRLQRMFNNRKTGLPYFNFPVRDQLDKDQLHVLDSLRSQFQERAPGTDPRGANTFYSFHGCRVEHVQNVCENGIVATQATDAGYFGSGCYSTLNVEYAARYARGDFDDPSAAPRTAVNNCYPVIMFACAVSMAYPVTQLDYGNVPRMPMGRSDFFGGALKPGFDCHVICVNETAGFQAVGRRDCEYVEVVIAQESQMLPVAVLWFER
jgi:hypothetical protein